MIVLIFILLAILLGCLLFLKLRNNKPITKSPNSPQTPTVQINTTKLPQIPQNPQTPSQNIGQDVVYNKFKNYLTQQGIPSNCIECVYTKLKIKYSKTDFDKFFEDVDAKNAEENPFVTDFFQFGIDCNCN